jgi:probable F420-dependent oxidoreductase
MEYGVTLPQGGRAANPDSIRRTAVLAEELGYSHVWVNDHITVPEGQTHPSPYIFDPLMTLATAAAVTTSIGLGSQITASYYKPLWLANALASLDTLSSGRLTIAIGVGWSPDEFDALGSNFTDRGARTDEIIGILRGAWENDYVPIDTAHYQLPPVKIAPKPAHRIPIWIAGYTEPAFRRAVTLGDGFHGEAGVDINESNLGERVARMRRDRPEESFTISVYTWEWNIGERDESDVLRERDAFEKAGVQHVVIALRSADADTRMNTVRRLAEILPLEPR